MEKPLAPRKHLLGGFRDRADAGVGGFFDGTAHHDAGDIKRNQLVDMGNPIGEDGDILPGKKGYH